MCRQKDKADLSIKTSLIDTQILLRLIFKGRPLVNISIDNCVIRFELMFMMLVLEYFAVVLFIRNIFAQIWS